MLLAAYSTERLMQFDRAFASLVGPEFCHHWYLNRDFLVPASSCVLILPLCFTKKIDFLK